MSCEFAIGVDAKGFPECLYLSAQSGTKLSLVRFAPVAAWMAGHFTSQEAALEKKHGMRYKLTANTLVVVCPAASAAAAKLTDLPTATPLHDHSAETIPSQSLHGDVNDVSVCMYAHARLHACMCEHMCKSMCPCMRLCVLLTIASRQIHVFKRIAVFSADCGLSAQYRLAS